MNIDVGTIAGDYQVIAILGEGGMGKVFKVRNVISDRQEAMKVLLPDLANAPDLANRFLREIKVTASLDHPNIAGLRTAVRVDNQLLMIMELVQGTTLEAKLKHGPLSVTEAVDYISQALAALGYAHRAGVIHRDIKPANMMLTPNGVIKLMDFGIAKNTTDRKLTQTGMTMGSLYYMSPEQIQGAETLDARADLYSLGITLYELVTGKRPFDGDSQFAIMSAHLQQQPVPPMTLDPKLPAALNDVILFSVQKDPNARFQTADAFRQALSSVTAAASPAPRQATMVSAPAVSTPPIAAAPVAAATAPVKSRRGLWVAAGAMCAVAAVVGVIELWPKKNAAAETAGAPPVTVSAPATSPEANPAVSAPPTSTPAVQTPVPSQSAGSVASPVSQPPQKNARENPAAAAQVQRGTQTSAPPPVQQQVQTSPVQAPPSQAVTQAPPAQTTPSTAAPAVAAPDQAVKRAELMKVRESLAQLSARAISIRTTLTNLERSNAAKGMGMRGDWVQASSLMESFLKAADDASKASDTVAAQDYMNKAERQIEKLETALNK